MSPGPSPAKKLRSINDAKYECGLCGRWVGSSFIMILGSLILILILDPDPRRYVKILDSHMKFVHGSEGGGRGAKYRCPQCSVLVTDLAGHLERRHGEHAERVVSGFLASSSPLSLHLLSPDLHLTPPLTSLPGGGGSWRG